jgi:anti-sigma B factor antagonist
VVVPPSRLGDRIRELCAQAASAKTDAYLKAIVDLSGRITLGEASVVVRNLISDLLGKGNKKILLNLGEVDYIDSSGIGVLVSSFSTVRSQGGELKLVNLSKRIRDLLQITKLYNLFDVKDDEAAAVASFRLAVRP